MRAPGVSVDSHHCRAGGGVVSGPGGAVVVGLFMPDVGVKTVVSGLTPGGNSAFCSGMRPYCVK